jgi:hypothetical protein
MQDRAGLSHAKLPHETLAGQGQIDGIQKSEFDPKRSVAEQYRLAGRALAADETYILS